MKLKYETSRGGRMMKGFAGVQAESDLLFDVISQRWVYCFEENSTDIPNCDRWISTAHAHRYNYNDDCKPYGHILPQTAPKSVRAFRRYLKKHSSYLLNGTVLVLDSWNTGKDVMGTIRNRLPQG